MSEFIAQWWGLIVAVGAAALGSGVWMAKMYFAIRDLVIQQKVANQIILSHTHDNEGNVVVPTAVLTALPGVEVPPLGGK